MNQKVFKRFSALFMALVMVIASLSLPTVETKAAADDYETVTIAEATFSKNGNTLPEGWVSETAGGADAYSALGYEKSIVTCEYDLSGYDQITITMKGRRTGTFSEKKAIMSASIDSTVLGTCTFSGTSLADSSFTFVPTADMNEAVITFICSNAVADKDGAAGIGSIKIEGKRAKSYDITIADGIVGGTVEADAQSAAAGTTVTLTATPEEGYSLKTFIVTDSEGAEVTVEDGAFVMPASEVTVSASFANAACAEGHTWVEDDAVYATKCDEAGVEAGRTCSVCGEKEGYEVIPAGEHVFGEGVMAVRPTFTTTGTMIYTCLVCDSVESEEIPVTKISTMVAKSTFDGKNKKLAEGWTYTATGVGSSGRTDCIVVGADENIASPGLDLSGYDFVTVDFTGRKIGIQDKTELAVYIVIDGEQVGRTTFSGSTATSAMPSITFETDSTMTDVILEFICTDAETPGLDGSTLRGAGFGSITINGITTTDKQLFAQAVNGTIETKVGEDTVLSAFTGETVTIVTEGNEGYVLEKLLVEDKATETEIEVTDNTFVMPSNHVLILAKYTFAECLEAGHSPINDDNAYEATCTTPGYTGDVICSVCHEKLEAGEDIPAVSHSYLDGVCENCGEACAHERTHYENFQGATCTTDGKHSDTVCDICGMVVVEGSVIEATGHSYNMGVCEVCGTECSHPIVEPYDEDNHSCDFCNDLYCHNWENGVCVDCGYACLHSNTYEENGVDATCTEAGREADVICEKCGVTVTEGSVIEAAGHNYIMGVCDICGYECSHPIVELYDEDNHSCDFCDYLYSHNWENGVCVDCGYDCLHSYTYEENGYDATCTEPGREADVICEKCGVTVTEGSAIEATGHSYVMGVCDYCGAECSHPIVEPYDEDNHSCDFCEDLYSHNWENGVCTDCGYACLHSYTYEENGYAATCTEAGREADVICEKCNVTVSEGQVIEAKDHSFDGEGNCVNCEYVCSHESYTDNGDNTKTCDECGMTETVEVVKKKNGLIYDNEIGNWVMYANDVIDTEFTDIYYHYDAWYYIENGKLNKEFVGLVDHNGVWYYVQDGKLNKEFKGIFDVDGTLVFVKDGKFLENISGSWVEEGVAYWITNGYVDLSVNGLKYANGSWAYYKDGVQNKEYKGLVWANNAWWYISNGTIDKEYNSLVWANNAWWYVNGGKLDKSYTGLTSYNGKLWYVTEGKLDKSYAGTTEYNGKSYTVLNGIGTIAQ